MSGNRFLLVVEQTLGHAAHSRNLERFLANPDGAQQLPGLMDGRARTLETLLGETAHEQAPEVVVVLDHVQERAHP